MSDYQAFFYRDGSIGFGKETPDGALLLLEGPQIMVRWIVGCTASRGYDSKYYVPGVNLTKDDETAFQAAIAFRDRLELFKTKMQHAAKVRACQ